MDGKHVLIKPPPNSGSYYFNYKHSFSIVLLTIVDANYKFLYTDIGCNGRISDGGVFRNCDMHKELDEKRLNIPNPTLLPSTHIPFLYMIVADDAFPLKKYTMKPFSQIGLTPQRRIYNYRRLVRLLKTHLASLPIDLESSWVWYQKRWKYTLACRTDDRASSRQLPGQLGPC